MVYFICFILLVFLLIISSKKPFLSFLNFSFRGILGGISLIFCQVFSLGLGCNLFNIAVLSLLGLPGFLSLLFMNLFL